ncbi:G2/M phase-specific E3 ubiquitin-protein ligase-like [Corticium candelabrum]|uniref:G2/M phase-specific E3 ubiquitin-protein ligase-like n=1 Tax=Corticium candelabrum TaxID=121492 RepID=UPI002E257FFE|nr:G2/M phase-specific E3 ubiquitin-protein ligase-like [Corticium candelabrum]
MTQMTAVDDGGPLREFFRLLILETGNVVSIFCGSEGKRVPAHNVLALQRNEYFFVGKCIALSITYGGPGPHFFSKSIARYLCGESITSPELEVPDYEIREKIEKVSKVQTTEQLRVLLDSEELSFRFEFGFSAPNRELNLEDKSDIVKSLSFHYLVYANRAELDQLMDGLQLMQQNSTLFRPLLQLTTIPLLTTSQMLKLFKPVWSELGSNKREEKESIILN